MIKETPKEIKVVNLSDCLLEFTALNDGKLILAEVKKGYVTKTQLKLAMQEIGYTYGIIESSLDLLVEGYTGQVPVALTFPDVEAGKLYFHFMNHNTSKDYMQWVKDTAKRKIDVFYKTKKNDRLLTLARSPLSIMRNPNGSKVVLQAMGEESVKLYSGNNTHLNDQKNALHASIDGCVHHSIYGVVNVYPIEKHSNIGKIHGHVNPQNALIVERDVRKGSKITIPSNLKVYGVIKSSLISAGGNIHCEFGMDNKEALEGASITAGQTIYSSMISNYEVWAGANIFVKTKILGSSVRAMDTIVVPHIISSRVYVGKTLYTNEISHSSHIFIGPDFVKDPDLKQRKNFHHQHEMRLNDLEEEMKSLGIELQHEKEKALAQLHKLNKLSKNSIASDLLLNRFYGNLISRINKYDEKLAEYEETLAVYREEKMQLSFSESQLKLEKDPTIYVLGTISSGTVITAPNQIIKVREPLKNIRIKMDRHSGTLTVVKLDIDQI